MTLIAPDPTGVRLLRDQLDAGAPIIVPLPSPLPYVVVGIDPAEVNAAKGRPRPQPVGAGVLSLDALQPALALERDALELARWLLFTEGAGVLIPVGENAPEWLAPATVDGMAFLGGAWLPGLRVLMEGRTHLYMSSGNATSGTPTVTAAEAEAVLGGDLLVVDGDALRDPTVAHGSSTMIAVGHDGTMTVARPGINNAAFGDDLDGYLDDLRSRRSRGARFEQRIGRAQRGRGDE